MVTWLNGKLIKSNAMIAAVWHPQTEFIWGKGIFK